MHRPCARAATGAPTVAAPSNCKRLRREIMPRSRMWLMTPLNSAIVYLLVSLLAPVVLQPAPPAIQRREFVIRDFKTESGTTLPEARVVYATLGTLNAAGSNAILLPSHYMANINGYNWLIVPTDRVFDPARDYLVLTELFGNGRSSSPSNTPEPLHGPRFPVMTIRDNVEAVHRLLTEELHVNHLRAVVGFSMGAEQALQWA